MEQKNHWSCTNKFHKKFYRELFFYWLQLPTMLGSSRFFVGCMKWQNAVILEWIWERDSIIILFSAKRTGLLTPLLTCFTLLSFSLFTWTNYFKSNSLSPFCFLGQKISKSNSSSLFSSDKNILSPASIL